MKHCKILLIVTIFLSLFFTGCENNDDPKTIISGERADLLTNDTWDVYQVIGNVNGTEVDITNNQDNPFKDCVWDFYSDGTYEITNGDFYEGTWKFNSSETSIIFDEGTGEEFSMRIVELSAGKLVLQYSSIFEGEVIEMFIKCNCPDYGAQSIS